MLATAALAAAVLLALPRAAHAGGASKATGNARKQGCTPQGAPAVTISPLSGATAAPADAQISFRGAPASDLREVSVVGSRSGPHTGSLRGYRSAKGASYVLSSPFDPGEQVEVQATVRAGRACRKIASSFTVAREAHPVYETPFEYPGTPGEMQHYESNNVKPPAVSVTQAASASSAPGDIFATPYLGPGEPGPMIFESSGRLVWFDILPTGYVGERFGVQSYRGQGDLVWWQGELTSLGFGRGEDVIMSPSYKALAHVKAGNGLSADLHDNELTKQGAAFVTAYQPVWISAEAAGGHGGPQAGPLAPGRRAAAKSRVVLDCVVQEIDVATGLVMWEWNSLGHVPLSESTVRAPAKRTLPYDYFHLAAVERLPGGNLKVAARGTQATYELAADSGRVRSRVETAAASFAAFEGDEQQLPGGGKLVYDGQSNAFAEYGPEGAPLYQVSFPAGDRLGRVQRELWYGQPEGRPGVATKLSGRNTEVFVSWNGSTQVASWELLAGESPATLQPVTTIPASGFQGQFSLPHVAFVKVLALGAGGQLIAESNIKETVHEGEE
ncbi:MAG: arylsulfotransferase family protein [Solirubrobacteraceae bacterium]